MPEEEWSKAGGLQPSSICHVGDYTIVTDGPSYDFHGTDDADANLIAAAPDLLAALLHAQEASAWYGADKFEIGGQLLGDVLRSAITKATGAA